MSTDAINYKYFAPPELDESCCTQEHNEPTPEYLDRIRAVGADLQSVPILLAYTAPPELICPQMPLTINIPLLRSLIPAGLNEPTQDT